MANYHAHVGTVSRGRGESLAQKAAYICGGRFRDDYCGLSCFYSREDVAHTEVFLPSDAPERFANPQTLVIEIDRAERRRDAQTARIIDFSLPLELSSNERIDFARRCVRDFWVNLGMCAILAIHDAGKGNPHAHLILSTRTVSSIGFGLKNREWNRRELYRNWRQFLAEEQNLVFQRKGLPVRVSEESYEVQGVDRTPTRYLGPKAVAMMKKGILTERAVENLIIMGERQRREQERERKRSLKKHHFRGRAY